MGTEKISPEEEKRLKGLGFIRNRGTDNFSARVITVNGRLSAEQLEHLAESARRFGDGYASLTTRLTVELTGIPYENIDAFTEFLNEGGFETGGTGNRVRPVVSCKGTTCRYGLLDSYAISSEIHERFYVGYHHVTLPHKFKIAVGGCPNNCIKPNLNDVGIMGWRGGFKMFIGGRWGKSYSIGREVNHIFKEKEELFDAIETAILLFKKYGKPGERFCFTIERLGFEKVEQMILSKDLLKEKQAILGDEV